MTKRQKKILIIQLLIFSLAVLLLYFTYYNKPPEKVGEIEKIQIKNEKEEEKTNTFENVEYKGIDLNGNRYMVKSDSATFELDKPELVNMKIMKAVFYFKDGTILTVTGDYGSYNNKTNDMKFRDNIIAKYEKNNVYSDKLDYINTKNILSISGNVRGESIQGNIKADNLNFDLSKQTLDISMFSDNQINVKLKDK